MSKCVNENCKNDPLKSPDRVLWGCDADFACNQYCYNEARKQMDREWGGSFPSLGQHEVCKDCGFTNFEDHQTLVCPSCLQPLNAEKKNKKLRFIFS